MTAERLGRYNCNCDDSPCFIPDEFLEGLTKEQAALADYLWAQHYTGTWTEACNLAQDQRLGHLV